jgi:hypothetical protein
VKEILQNKFTREINLLRNNSSDNVNSNAEQFVCIPPISGYLVFQPQTANIALVLEKGDIKS